MTELNDSLRLPLRKDEDDNIILYKDHFKQVHHQLCGLEEVIKDYVVTIKMKGRTIQLPSLYEIMQTEESEIDMVPLSNILPISLLSIDGTFAINLIEDYTTTLGTEKVHWIVPSIPRKHFLVLDGGLIINPNPYRHKKDLVKRLRKKKKKD